MPCILPSCQHRAVCGGGARRRITEQRQLSMIYLYETNKLSRFDSSDHPWDILASLRAGAADDEVSLAFAQPSCHIDGPTSCCQLRS